ncbi:MAG: hypothetical protein H6564_02145 [Lewinellaceae bacterium]|nr:hypothetical protein [Lewinellaceae bacterium]
MEITRKIKGYIPIRLLVLALLLILALITVNQLNFGYFKLKAGTSRPSEIDLGGGNPGFRKWRYSLRRRSVVVAAVAPAVEKPD